MPKFLIELRHDPQPLACARIIQTFLKTGSHYLTHAEWGCKDGEHTAWIVVDVGSREEARSILPPAYRSEAKIIALNTFSIEHIESEIARLER